MVFVSFVAAVGGIGLFLGSDHASSAPREGGDLFGGAYLSTVVKSDGAQHRLFRNTDVAVRFDHRNRRDVVMWSAKCNRFGARVDVRSERLLIRRIEGTEQFCGGRRSAQDEWLVRFFSSNPRWRASGSRARLATDGRVIALQRDRPPFDRTAETTGREARAR